MTAVLASELKVVITADARDAQKTLRDMYDQIQRLGQARIPDTLQDSITAVSNASVTAAKSTKELNEAQAAIRVDSAVNAYAALSAKLDLARERVAALSVKYGEADLRTKAAANAVDVLSGKLTVSASTLQLTKDKLDAVKQSSGNAVPPLHQMREKIDDVAQAGGRLNSKLNEVVVGGLRSIGSALTQNLLPAIGNLIGQSADFQQNLNLLQQSSKATAAEMAVMSAKAKELGADMSLPGASAAGAVEAMLNLNRAGLSLNDTVAASHGVLLLSTAAQIDNAKAAEVVAGALNTFSMSGDKATTVADQFAAGAAESMSSVEDLAYGFKNAGASFNLLGQDSDDLITSLAMLSSTGLDGATSGTALNAAMMALASPTDKAKNLMADLGLNIRGANGQILPMRELIGELAAKVGTLEPEAKAAAMSTLFLGEGVKGLAPLIDGGVSAFDQMNSKVNEYGAASSVAAAQSQGLNGAIEGAKSSFENLAGAAITPLLPLMESFVRGAADLAGNLAEYVGPAMTGFVNGLQAAYDIAKPTFEFISANAVPIAAALGAAALATAGHFGLLSFSLVGFGQAIAIAAASAGTAALAFAAVAIPIAAIAVAIGATAFAFVEFNRQLDDASARGLSSRDAYVDAKTAIDELSQATTDYATNQALIQEAEKLRVLTERHKALYERMTGTGSIVQSMQAQWFDSNEVLAAQATELKGVEAEMAALTNAIKLLKGGHDEQNQQIAAGIVGLHGMREGYGTAADGVTELRVATGLMGAALAQVNADIASATGKGMDIFGGIEGDYRGHTESMARLQTEFNTATDEKTKAAIATQMTDAIVAYAQQEQIQRESMGRQLMSLAELEGQKAGLSQAAIAEMTSGIAAEYGVLESATSAAYGGMSGSIADWAANGGESTASVIAGLTETSDAALATQRAVSEMTGNYELRLETNLKSGQIDAETFNKLMRETPSKHNLQLFQNFMSGTLSADEFLMAVNAVPKELTTVLNVDATSGMAAAYAAGANFTLGMANGILSGQYMVANASQKTAQTAALAAKNYLQIQSPSRLMFAMGAFIPMGMAEGIESKGATVGEALVSVIGKGASKATIAAAEGIGKIADTVSGAVDALNKLNEFARPTGDSIVAMAESLQFLVNEFAARVVSIKPKAAEAIKAYSEVASSIVGVVKNGADAFASLATFQGVNEFQLLGFIDAVALTVREFAIRSTETNADLYDTATAFAETGGAAIALIGDGVSGFAKLADFQPIAENQIILFSLGVRDLVRSFIARVAEIDVDLLGAAGDFADTAGKAIGTIASGIEAFSKLVDYSSTPEAALQAFSVDLQRAIAMMVRIAADFSEDGIESTAVFADAVGKIIAPISDAVGTFGDLAKYSGLPQNAIGMIGADMRSAVNMMQNMAASASTEGVASAALFSTSLVAVFSGMAAGIDALSSLSDYSGVSQESVSLLQSDMFQAIGVVQALAGMATSAAAEGVIWRDTLAAFAENVKAGIESLSSLDGLNISVSASVSAASGGGESGGEGAADGSHASGLWRVPFDGYRATVHADEAILSSKDADLWRAMVSSGTATAQSSPAPMMSSPSTNSGSGDGMSGGGGANVTVNLNVNSDLDTVEVAYTVCEIIERQLR